MRLLIALVLLAGCRTAQSKPELIEDLCGSRPELAVCRDSLTMETIGSGFTSKSEIVEPLGGGDTTSASPGAAPGRGVIVSTGAAHVPDTDIVRIQKAMRMKDSEVEYWKALAIHLREKHQVLTIDEPPNLSRTRKIEHWKTLALYLSEKYQPVRGVEISSSTENP